MREINPLLLFVLCITVMGLSACNTTSGRPWVFNPDARPAKEPPAPLSGPLADAKQTQQGTANQDQFFDQGPDFGFDVERVPADGTPGKVEAQRLEIMPVQASRTVKIGMLLPLSGQHKKLGQAMLDASQLALFDVGGTQFELMPRDTKGTAEGAAQAARKVIDDGADLILGPVFSASVQAAAGEARRSGVSMVAYTTDWAQAGGGTFVMGFLPFDQIQRVVQYAAYQGVKDVAVIAPDTPYGNIVVSAYQAYAQQYNLNTVKVEMFPPILSNLSPTIRSFTDYDERQAFVDEQNVMNPQPEGEELEVIDLEPPYDAVLMPVGGQLAISVSNLLSHYDLPPSKVRRLGTGLFDDPALSNEESLRGAWFAAPSPKLRRYFETQFKENFGYTPPRLASLAYDSTALAAVLAKRGLEDGYRSAFDRNAISNANGFAGIDGIFRFRSDGTAERGLAVLEAQRGRFKIVEDAPSTFEEFAPF